MGHYRIAVMEGDGIGPEIVRETVRVMKAAADITPGLSLAFEELPVGLKGYEEHGHTLPEVTREGLARSDGWLLGPLTTHAYQGPNQPNCSAWLRTRYELYANIRPSRSFPKVRCLYPNVDLVIVRENTEGFYADRNMQDRESGEFIPAKGVAIAMRVVTEVACERLARTGFEQARRRKAAGKPGKVSLIHKANVLRKSDGLFLETCRRVAAEYPDIAVNDFHIDAAAMHLVMRPHEFDVIVTTNMFGDILSDEAAGLVGGLGMAPGLNAGVDRAMAQATHGSAPDIAGRGIANPIAEILSGAMLLDWLGGHKSDASATAAAHKIEVAVAHALAQGEGLTPDLGGNGSTSSLGEAVAWAVLHR